MNKKGFTLIELLAAIILIALLGGIGIVSYRTIFKTSEERYYNAIESNMMLAGNDYFEDHRNELPIGSEFKEVTLTTLVNSKYMEEVKDTEGNTCTTGSVFAYRENNKYKYEACLTCGGYESSGRFCNTVAARVIEVHARRESSESYDYDVLRSYNSQVYTNDENVIVSLSMASEYDIERYVAINVSDNSIQQSCMVSSENTCEIELDETGSYRVVAYDDEDNEISSRYVNVKIARGGSDFSLKAESSYLINKTACSSGNITRDVTIEIVPTVLEDFKSIEYQLNEGEPISNSGLKINLNLGSGHYMLNVTLTNYAGEVSARTIEFDVTYMVTIVWGDGETDNHPVVKGHNYNFVESLPESRGEFDQIRWFKNGDEVFPTDIITDACSFNLEGRTATEYSIIYYLNNGILDNDNPDRYYSNNETFTLNNPTREGYTFFGWVGSNDVSKNLGQYTPTTPYAAGGRDHILGDEFDVTPGVTYRVILTAKRKTGTIALQGGLWYTEKTSGTAYEGYSGEFKVLELLEDGYARYYKDVTVPDGKSKAKAYVQLEQQVDTATTSWDVCNIHVVVSPTSVSVSAGTEGNLSYDAVWKANTYSITLDSQGANTAGTTKVYYQYKTTADINGVKCFYYSDSTLNTCISTSGYTITTPTKTGYAFSGYFTATNGGGNSFVTGAGVFVNNIYQNLPRQINSSYTNDIKLYAKWVPGTYTLNFNENVFSATTQTNNGLTATFTEDGNYLTLNGTATTTNMLILWNLEKRALSVNDQYRITLKYVSGTLSCSDSSNCTGSKGRPHFVFDLAKNENTYSDRGTAPISFIDVNFPTSGTEEKTFTISEGRATGDGLEFWMWQQTASNSTFTNYKVQILITKVSSKSVTQNQTYGTLPTPTRTGYDFNGWYTAPTGGTKITDTTTFTAAGSQTLYAHWTSHKFKLAYNGNGSDVSWCSTHASLGMDSSKYPYYVSDNSRYYHTRAYGQYMSQADGLNNYDNASWFCFSKTGYKAASGNEWVLSNNSSKKYNHNDGSLTAQGMASDAGCNLATTSTCTAQVNVNWASGASYKLTFDANGGSVSPTTKSVTYGQTYNDLPTPTRTGYSFRGWYGSYDGTAAKVVNYGRAYMYTNKLSVHFSAYMSNWANYGRAISCTEGGGWNLEPGTNVINFACYDSGVGYKSAGWGVAFSTLAAGWHDFDLIFNGTNAKLYVDGTLRGTSANYSSGKIGYHSSNSIFVGGEAAGTATTPTTPYFNGYVGNLVIKNTDAITSSSTYNSISAPAQNQTLYAKWVANTCTIAYNANGGSGAPGNTSYTYASSGTINLSSTAPSRTGYTFKGWSTSSVATSATYAAGAAYNKSNCGTSGTTTLYAVWQANTYTITYNANGGSGAPGSTTYTYAASGNTNLSSSIPSRTGYTFKGWSTSSTATSASYSAGQAWSRSNASNYTLYAVWQINTYTITFAGVNPISTSYDGQTVTLSGSVAVPAVESNTLSLATNTNYVVSFDYKCASGSNQFDVDFFPDTLPQTNPTATTTLRHMDWITSSSNSNMSSCKLRFFDDIQGSGETDITITNIMLSKTSTKQVTYNNTYGDLPAPTRSGYTFVGWFTEENGGAQVISSSTMNTPGNHTLFARWQKNAPSCFPWKMSLTCSGAYSDLSKTTYYETQYMCNNACNNRPSTAFCGCTCTQRSC
jgi:uncharacterized repeat protein (TIGR02543 family)/prepilin-type N-terminal cleavage/methylation domain-containing protein